MTDYAIVVLSRLAAEGEGASLSAPQLAGQTGIPEPTVAKVLKMLARDKLLDSVRGAAGGYKLSRRAQELSLCDIIEAVDGPIAIASCVEGADEHCVAEKRCPARGRWDPVNRAIKEALQGLKLADMAGRACGTASAGPALVKVTLPKSAAQVQDGEAGA
jgi:FeS assembly SUF system regulator